MGSYQIQKLLLQKRKKKEDRAQITVGKSWQLYISRRISNVTEIAKTEHRKTSITTLTYFGFYSIPLPIQLPGLNLLSRTPAEFTSLLSVPAQLSLPGTVTPSAYFKFMPTKPQVSPASLAITLFLKPIHPPILLRDFLNLFPSVKPQHLSCISSGHDLVSLENGSNHKNF